MELTQLDALTEQLENIESRLNEIGKHDPRIARIKTIPGVGPRTAEILVACIDDPQRFHNGREVSAYFGLVPRQYQSGETDRNGRITKRGNPLARTILVENVMRKPSASERLCHQIAGYSRTSVDRLVRHYLLGFSTSDDGIADGRSKLSWAMSRTGK